MGIYLSLVALCVLVTALLMSTVVMHRTFIHRHLKQELVDLSDLLLCVTLVLVGLILAGTIGLVFDIVLAGKAGVVAAAGIALVLLVLWLPVPHVLRRRALAGRRSHPIKPWPHPRSRALSAGRRRRAGAGGARP